MFVCRYNFDPDTESKALLVPEVLAKEGPIFNCKEKQYKILALANFKSAVPSGFWSCSTVTYSASV